MALPAPNLDDRRFQELVDDAKRLVQQRCPEWTDHNVSDPGVTLIEAFAWMTDLMLYRLNRVPERHYVKFLELLGVQLFPPTAAHADVTFWLSGPTELPVRVVAGSEVATQRTEGEEPIAFTTATELSIVPCEAAHLASSIAEGQLRDHDQTLRGGPEFYAFDRVPKPDDALYIGLSEPVPHHVITLRLEAQIEGIGVDPTFPPLVWEAWTGHGWTACELDRDSTGGINRAGDVVLHVPPGHEVSVLNTQRGGWIRARVVEAVEGQPAYSASPRIASMRAFTIGATVEAVHAETVIGEILGVSEGVPGQRFPVLRPPVVPGVPLVLEVAAGEGWTDWQPLTSFADASADDRVFQIDATGGEVILGPQVRLPDGGTRQFGAVPPKGASLRLPSYRTGGGRKGNVAAKAISILRSSIPFVARIENRRAASGGVDGEDLENAKVRGPIMLRTRNRAVTIEDYEALAREAAPEIARIRAVPAGSGSDPGGVRVLVVPATADEALGRLRFEQLVPDEAALARIASYLDERRVLGARVMVEPPSYQGITIVARVRARHRANPERLRDECLVALYGYFHPVTGGPDGDGWPFGRAVHVGEVYSVLQRLNGVEIIEDARLFAADPITGARGQAVQRLELDSNALVFSFEHQVLVEAS